MSVCGGKGGTGYVNISIALSNATHSQTLGVSRRTVQEWKTEGWGGIIAIPSVRILFTGEGCRSASFNAPARPRIVRLATIVTSVVATSTAFSLAHSCPKSSSTVVKPPHLKKSIVLLFIACTTLASPSTSPNTPRFTYSIFERAACCRARSVCSSSPSPRNMYRFLAKALSPLHPGEWGGGRVNFSFIYFQKKGMQRIEGNIPSSKSASSSDLPSASSSFSLYAKNADISSIAGPTSTYSVSITTLDAALQFSMRGEK